MRIDGKLKLGETLTANMGEFTVTNDVNAWLGQGYTISNVAASEPFQFADLSEYRLTIGGMVAVRFVNGAPAGSTLNINSTGNIPLYYRGQPIGDNDISRGDSVLMAYDGYVYHVIAIDASADIGLIQAEVTAIKTDVAVVQSDVTAIKADVSAVNDDVAQLDYRLSQMLNVIYPVGSYYETSDATFDPNVSFVGEWELEDEGLAHVSAGNAGYRIGQTGGESEHILTESEIPNISGTFILHGQENGSIIMSRNGKATGTYVSGKYKNGGSDNTGSQCVINPGFAFGGGQSHNNMPPYIAVNRWHRTR